MAKSLHFLDFFDFPRQFIGHWRTLKNISQPLKPFAYSQKKFKQNPFSISLSAVISSEGAPAVKSISGGFVKNQFNQSSWTFCSIFREELNLCSSPRARDLPRRLKSTCFIVEIQQIQVQTVLWMGESGSLELVFYNTSGYRRPITKDPSPHWFSDVRILCPRTFL
jgi:hypothetical protein